MKDMEYYLTQNIMVTKGITNSSKIKVKQIVIDKIDPRPKFLICELLNDKVKFVFDNLEPNNFILIETTKSFYIGRNSKESLIYRKQFPIIPCFASTIYRAQGQTNNHAIIDLQCPDDNKIKTSFAYVALSR